MSKIKERKKIIILACILIVSGQTMGSIRVKPTKIRLVEITVIDADTKEPIPEVMLYYHVKSAYFKSFMGIPSPFSVYTRDLILKKFETDFAGRVFIPEQKVWIKPFHEVIESVRIYINFDFKEEKSKKGAVGKFDKTVHSLILDEDDADILSNDRYKTFILYGFFFEDDEDEADSPTKKKLIDNPDETPVYRRESINYGPRREKSKKVLVIELPLKGKGSECQGKRK